MRAIYRWLSRSANATADICSLVYDPCILVRIRFPTIYVKDFRNIVSFKVASGLWKTTGREEVANIVFMPFSIR